MSVPTQPVTVRLADFGGESVANVTVRARMNGVDYTTDGTFVGTNEVTAITDANGQAVLHCFPNAPAPTGLGTRGTLTQFTAQWAGSRSLKVVALIPDEPCNLVNIVTDENPAPLTDAQAAILQAQSSAAAASTSADAAAGSADAASASADAAAEIVTTVQDLASAAADSASAANESANAAGSSATNADASSDAAAESEFNAASAAAAAEQSAEDAAASQDAAADSAAEAAESAELATSNGAAQVALAAAQVALATGQVSVATARASEASGSADAAAAAAGAASGSASAAASSQSAAAVSAGSAGSSAASAAAVVPVTLGHANTAQAQAALAQAYAASVGSVAQQDLAGSIAQAAHRSPNTIVGTCFMDASQDSNPLWPQQMGGRSWEQESLAGAYIYSTLLNFAGIKSELVARAMGGKLGANLLTGTWAGWSGGAVSLDASGLITVTPNGFFGGSMSFPSEVGASYLVTGRSVGANLGRMYINDVNSTSGSETNEAPLVNGFAFVTTAVAATTYALLSANASGQVTQYADIKVQKIEAWAPSGSYYNDATDGKHKRLWKNLVSRSESGLLTSYNSNSPGTFATESTMSGYGGAIAIARNAAAAVTLFPAINGNLIPAGVQCTIACVVEMDDLGVPAIGTSSGASDFYLALGGTPPSGQTVTAFGGNRYLCTGTGPMGSSAGATGLYKHNNNTARGFKVTAWDVAYGPYAAYEKKDSADGSQSEVFRGNKKQFPAAGALGVLEAARVVIYDTLEPGCPMWRVYPFISGVNASGVVTLNSIAYKDGVISITGNSGLVALHMIDVAKDRAVRITNSAGGLFNRVWDRAFDYAFHTQSNGVPGALAIASASVNAVDMTTMPDAPMDPVTRLAVPTVMVGTASGASIIHNDGRVVSDPSGNNYVGVTINKDFATAARNGSSILYYAVKPGSLGAGFSFSTIANNATHFTATSTNKAQLVAGRSLVARIPPGAARAMFLRMNESDPLKGVGYDLADLYAIGMYCGDIRRMLGGYVAPGTIGGAVTVADLSTGWSSADARYSYAASSVTWAGGGGSNQTNAKANAVAPNMSGKYVALTYTLSGYTGTGNCGVEQGQLAADAALTSLVDTRASANGTYTFYGYWRGGGGANLGTTLVLLGRGSNGFTVSGFQVVEVAPDRSYKSQPAPVYGTISLTPIAAASQLQVMGGWSNSNYIQQAYSADLDGVVAWRMLLAVPAALDLASFPKGAELRGSGTPTLAGAATAAVNPGDGTGSVTRVDGTNQSFLMWSGLNPASYYAVGLTNTTVAAVNINIRSGGSGGTIILLAPSGQLTTGYVTNFSAGNLSLTSGTNGETTTFTGLTLKEITGALILWERAAPGLAGARQALGIWPDGKLVAIYTDATGTTRTATTAASYLGQTPVVDVVYSSDGKLAIIVNGEEVASATGTPLGSLTNASAVLTIGNSNALNAPATGVGIAWVKPAATVPSANALRAMAADERAMCQPGAQVTLADSGAVVDMAYDPVTNRWSAASAANVSEFVGLVRVAATPVPAGSFARVYANGGTVLTARTGTNPGLDITAPAQNLKEKLRLHPAQPEIRSMEFELAGGATDVAAPTGWEFDAVDLSTGPQRETQPGGTQRNWQRKFDGFQEFASFHTGPNTWGRARIRRSK